MDVLLLARIQFGFTVSFHAYTFINACVTTQSKREMSISKNLFPYARGCPNMPTTYSQAFDAALKAHDRF